MTSELGARQIAKLISEGKLPPQHLGVKSFLVLKQEIFSLMNRYNPKTMSEFEKVVYAKDLAGTIEGILRFDEKGQRKLFAMFNQTLEEDPQKDLEKKEEIKSQITSFSHIDSKSDVIG